MNREEKLNIIIPYLVDCGFNEVVLSPSLFEAMIEKMISELEQDPKKFQRYEPLKTKLRLVDIEEIKG